MNHTKELLRYLVVDESDGVWGDFSCDGLAYEWIDSLHGEHPDKIFRIVKRQGGTGMNHTKEPCPYCDERPTPIIEKQGLKVSLDEDGDIFVSLELGSGTPARVYKTANYCPMCGRKLEDV